MVLGIKFLVLSNKIKKIRLLAVGLLVLAVCPSIARAQVTLEADTIVLGDQTVLSVPIVDSMPSVDFGGKVVMVSQQVDSASRTLQAVVTSFEPGEHWLRIDNDDSLLLVVTDVEVDTASQEIRDIAPLQRMPYTFWEIFRWVLLVLGVAAVALLVWWFLKHRRKIEQVLGVSAPVDTRTPEERALESLEALRRGQLWQSGKVKEYHTELTDVVRRFIEETTDIRATDMTSSECVDALMQNGLGADAKNTQALEQTSIQALKDIFATADMVKFAKSEPLPHEHERSLREAAEFVKTMWQAVNANKQAEEPSTENPSQEKEVPHE